MSTELVGSKEGGDGVELVRAEEGVGGRPSAESGSGARGDAVEEEGAVKEGAVEEEASGGGGAAKLSGVLKQLAFPAVCLAAEAIMLALYFVGTTYGDVASATAAVVVNGSVVTAGHASELDHFYPMFQDVHGTCALYRQCCAGRCCACSTTATHCPRFPPPPPARAVMVFVGFGFLMTFLKKYGYSSVGLNFVVSALVIQWSILSNGFWHQAFGTAAWHKIELSIETLITADFAAAAVLITFGALLGKVTPAQLMVVALVEIVFYGINENIGAGTFGAVDMGGSIFVHTFGAYFGLACSFALGLAWTRKRGAGDPIGALSKPTLCLPTSRRVAIDAAAEEAEENNASSTTSDMFAMVGTLFLWMFWPSFNGALAAEHQQHRVVINTLLSLCACCVSAFLFSALLRGVAHQLTSNGEASHYKFDMVDVQNATLAGGVAVGSAADLVIDPAGAILIGIIAGFVSVLGCVL